MSAGGLSPFDLSMAERYHEETKYTEEGLKREAGRRGLPDPARQPAPYKRLDGPRVPLSTEGLPFVRPEPLAPAGGEPLARLARVLWHTNGVTRVVRYAGGIQPFRAAPSAGAMYPTEVYVAVRGFAGIEDGVYDYQILDHSLALVRGEDPFPALAGALHGHAAATAADAVVILTAEWYRSSWRYRERGYRRALLDTGHVLGNLVAYAPVEGFAAVPFGGFADGAVERLLGVDPVDEGPLVVAPLVPFGEAGRIGLPAPRISGATAWRAALAEVGDRLPEGAPERLFAALHLAGRIDADAPAADRAEWPPAAGREEAGAVEVGTGPTSFDGGGGPGAAIARRRSTRGFLAAPVAKDALLRALAYSEGEGADALFVPELIRTWLVTVRVPGLPAGAWAAEKSPLRLVPSRRGDFSAALLHLGLGQAICRDAAAAVIHTVDLPRAVRLLGDRVYRLATLDAGHLGERWNLSLLQEGIGVSGVGGYLDDEMGRVLGIPENQAVIYITALGSPGEANGSAGS